MPRYVPERGDLVWLDFHPQSGHEQTGRRPALVVSPAAYNGKAGLALFCPITSQIKGYPFEIELMEKTIRGVVLCDQVRSLDWRARRAKFVARVERAQLRQVLARIRALLHDEVP